MPPSLAYTVRRWYYGWHTLIEYRFSDGRVYYGWVDQCSFIGLKYFARWE